MNWSNFWRNFDISVTANSIPENKNKSTDCPGTFNVSFKQSDEKVLKATGHPVPVL